MPSQKTQPLAHAVSSEDELEQQKRIWTQEQELVASRVMVHSDPENCTKDLKQCHPQSHDRNVSAIAVENTRWCKVLRPLYPNYNDTNGAVHNRATPLPENQQQTEMSRYLFGGVDVGFPNPPKCINHTDEELAAVAVYVIIDIRTMEVVYRDHEWIPMSELPPYISTFLAFREIDPLERLVAKQLSLRPELTPSAILVDGNGIFHPRHSGIACFLGVRTGIPTIGIGKTLLWIENSDGKETDNSSSNNSSSSSNNNNNEINNNADSAEYQWTRSKLDEYINRVLASVHRRIVYGDDDPTDDENSCHLGLAKRFEEHNGLILYKGSRNNEVNDETAPAASSSREQLLETLAPFCNGIAIPLESPNRNNTNDERFLYLGAALIGHGGSGMGRKNNNKTPAVGSKKQIIVSVGHDLSLSEAVSITANLSRFRIPEPVREADLYGRELLRQRKML